MTNDRANYSSEAKLAVALEDLRRAQSVMRLMQLHVRVAQHLIAEVRDGLETAANSLVGADRARILSLDLKCQRWQTRVGATNGPTEEPLL